MDLDTWDKWTRPIKKARLRKMYRRSPLPYRWPRYRRVDKQGGDYGILSADPPILYVPYWVDERLILNQTLTPLFDYLANTRAYFLYRWLWWIQEPERVDVVKRFEQQHHRRYPKHQFIHLCNTPQMVEVFCAHGLNAILCHENAFLDERLFFPMPGIPKTWDAVYDARFKDYKRHELAVEISSLALIYDVNPYVDIPAYVDRVRREFSHAHFFNHDDEGEYHQLAPAQVNTCLNACRVGLCLSAVEGGNAASMQYLLSGLPVVSTASRGGRDVFFDDDYVLIVDDTPQAVCEGVEAMIRRGPDPDMIRTRSLNAIAPHRRALIDCVQKIYDAEGVSRQFAAEWDAVYFNKLARYQRHAETISRIETARAVRAAER